MITDLNTFRTEYKPVSYLSKITNMKPEKIRYIVKKNNIPFKQIGKFMFIEKKSFFKLIFDIPVILIEKNNGVKK